MTTTYFDLVRSACANDLNDPEAVLSVSSSLSDPEEYLLEKRALELSLQEAVYYRE